MTTALNSFSNPPQVAQQFPAILRAVAESPTLAVHILRQGRWPVAFMVDVMGINDQFPIGGGKALVVAHGMQVLTGENVGLDEITSSRRAL